MKWCKLLEPIFLLQAKACCLKVVCLLGNFRLSIKMGFVTGDIDAPRLAQPAHRRRLALAIATGILDYLKREVR